MLNNQFGVVKLVSQNEKNNKNRQKRRKKGLEIIDHGRIESRGDRQC